MRKKRKSNNVRSDTSIKSKRVKRMAKKASVSRVSKTRNAGTFTESAFWQFIRSALRNKSRWWKPRLLCLQNARRPSQSSNKRLKWEFQCSHCLNWFPQKQVEVNHKNPVGKLNCASDLPDFVENLFCEVDFLEIACKKCHSSHHSKN